MTALQLVLSGVAGLWLIPLLLTWVRYNRLPHSAYMLSAILAAPLMLADEVILAFDLTMPLAFLLGVFKFAPLLVVTLFFFAMHRLLVEKPLANGWLYWLPCILLFLAEVPFLIAPADLKIEVMTSPIVGAPLVNWPIYTHYLLVNLSILLLSFKVDSLISHYQSHLSEQVVDINHYKMPMTVGMFSGMITLAFGVILLVAVIATGLVNFTWWMGMTAVVQSLLFLVLALVLVEKRRYSPSPLDYHKMKKHKYSNHDMRAALTMAEKAVVRSKAYKRIGLRLRHLADAAGVEPQLLAVSTRELLNRNFRAFIYHYRLEYAKNVLMRSDASVAAVAKRLGFDSEKFLSNVFEKYVAQMTARGQTDKEESEEIQAELQEEAGIDPDAPLDTDGAAR